MPIPLALIPILAGIGISAATGAGAQALQRRATRKGNERVMQKAQEMTAPTQQPYVSEDPIEGSQQLNQLFQSVLGALPTMAPIEPPKLPELTIPSKYQASYNISSKGQLSAAITPTADVDALRGARENDWMQSFTHFYHKAPPGTDPTQYGIEQAGRLGYMPPDPSWMKYYDPSPEEITQRARAMFMREYSRGAGFQAARTAVDTSIPGVSLESWEAIKEEAFQL